MTAMSSESPLISKFKSFDGLDQRAIAIFNSFSARRRKVDPQQPLVHEHDISEDAYLIQSGWTCVYKLLPDGGRQIVGFPLPGDIVGLSNFLLGRAVFSLESLSEAVVSPVSSSTIIHAISTEPNVARALLWSFARDNAIMIEHLANIGRRSALTRTAHFLLEFSFRLQLIGVDTTDGFAFPLNQYVIADALSLTSIHLNRILRQLREAELVTLRSGRVVIHDLRGLMELAAFDPSYLMPPARRQT